MFELYKELDSARYYKFLADEFLPKLETPTYGSLIAKLGKISPLFIVTTNVDQALEVQVGYERRALLQ